MTKTVYDPNCLSFCSDLCGIRCQNLCNKDHISCPRGILADNFLFCPSADSLTEDMTLGFVTFESKEVDTFGKGKPYKRIEKVVTDYHVEEYTEFLRSEFLSYGEHTLSYWFLRSTKLEAFVPSDIRSASVTITSDFGEQFKLLQSEKLLTSFITARR